VRRRYQKIKRLSRWSFWGSESRKKVFLGIRKNLKGQKEEKPKERRTVNEKGTASTLWGRKRP